MNKTEVSIVKTPKNSTSMQIESNVRKAVELVNGLDDIKSGDLVILKPNLCAPSQPGTAATTNPLVVKAVADLVREKGGRVVIAESTGVLDEYTEKSFEANGYYPLRDQGYELLDLKADNTVMRTVQIPNGEVLQEITLPDILFQAKLIISIPVMKTHMGQRITVGLKNMKGIIPDPMKKKLHTKYGVAPGMIDVFKVIKPGLVLIDGILAQEGLGPMIGTVVEMNLFIAGKDAVAVDAVAATIMGFDIHEVPLVIGASDAGLGIADLQQIEIIGAPIKDVQRRFKRVEEAVKEALPDDAEVNIVIGEKACTGCRESVWAIVYELNKKNLLGVLKGWTIFVGQSQKCPEVPKDKLLLVGNCTAKFKKNGTFVVGCPPQPWDIMQALSDEPMRPMHEAQEKPHG
jgi:uncharacterized protein (DUF362 family)